MHFVRILNNNLGFRFYLHPYRTDFMEEGHAVKSVDPSFPVGDSRSKSSGFRFRRPHIPLLLHMLQRHLLEIRGVNPTSLECEEPG